MRALFLLILTFVSCQSLASDNYYPSLSDSFAACEAFRKSAYYHNSTSCAVYGGDHYSAVHCQRTPDRTDGVTKSTPTCSNGWPLVDFRVFYFTGCPEGTEPDPADGNRCDVPPDYAPGDTAVAECYSWNPECNDSDIVDADGNLWTNDHVNVCDPPTCINQWTKTDQQYDPLDPSTWPDGAISSGDINAPSIPGPDESNPFDNYIPGLPGEVTTETDTSSTSSSDGSNSTTTTTTEIGWGDSGITKTQTTQTTSSDTDGNTTTTTTTKTTDSSGNVSTTTSSTTTDSGGNVTATSSGSSTDEGGEQEETPSSVAGGGSCSSRPSCEGDPIQCAILLENWRQACSDTDFITPTGPSDLDSKITALEAEFDTLFNSIKSDIHAELGLTLASSGTIDPNYVQIFGVDVDFSFYRWTAYLSIIGTIILAMAWLSALYILLTGRD